MNTVMTKILILIFATFSFNIAYTQSTKKEYVEIEVHTGEESGAGTNKLINLRLWADDNLAYNQGMLIYDLTKYVDGNAFERGSVDKFSYLLPHFTKLNKMSVIVNNITIGSGNWYLKKIVVRQANGARHIFECNRWIESSGGKNGKVTLTPRTIDSKMEAESFLMNVEVHTGDKRGAGTNSNVYLSLNTDTGDGSPIKLNNKISGNAFESGDVDKLNVRNGVFKKLHSINIRHDNKGAGAGWYLDQIRIKTPFEGVKTFDCKCWLEGSDNGRTLYPRNN